MKVEELTAGVRSNTRLVLVYMKELVYPEVLEQIPAEAYPAAQWRGAACYLSCPRLMNESAVQIRRGLLETTA